MDYGDEICYSAMETGVGLHRCLHHGCQPRDSKVLQSCGEPFFYLSNLITQECNFAVVASLYVRTLNILFGFRIFGIQFRIINTFLLKACWMF